MLARVEDSLPRNFSLLYPSGSSLWPYYSVLSTSIYFSSGLDTMIVAVSIPLVDKGNELNLYRVHNLPLKVRLFHESNRMNSNISTGSERIQRDG